MNRTRLRATARPSAESSSRSCTCGGGSTIDTVGGIAADSAEAFSGIDSTLLLAALGVVIVMLLITYRSPTLLIMPLLSVIAALFSAQAVIYLLAAHAGLTVNG